MNNKFFTTIEELKSESTTAGISKCELKCLNGSKTIEQATKEISRHLRLQYLILGYLQFAENCPWNEFTGINWTQVLSEQPQFAEFCQWEKLTGYNWSYLLRYQPKFAKFCDWGKLTGHNWSCLLSYQPKFAKHCQWIKLDKYDLLNILGPQPQLAKLINTNYVNKNMSREKLPSN